MKMGVREIMFENEQSVIVERSVESTLMAAASTDVWMSLNAHFVTVTHPPLRDDDCTPVTIVQEAARPVLHNKHNQAGIRA
jgi:hypothetical protein